MRSRQDFWVRERKRGDSRKIRAFGQETGGGQNVVSRGYHFRWQSHWDLLQEDLT